MSIVAVGADRRAHVAAGNGFRVHALAVCKQWSITDATSLHYVLVTVAAAASLRDVCAIDR